jgi:hypothetical protein
MIVVARAAGPAGPPPRGQALGDERFSVAMPDLLAPAVPVARRLFRH